MATVLNVLAGILVVLYFALRRMFAAVIGRGERPLRHKVWMRAAVMGAWGCLLAFLTLGLWALATGGYLPVAAALAFFCGVAVLRGRGGESGESAKMPDDGDGG